MASEYSANYFSGANISIFIGPYLLTEVFGISWQEMESLQPEYGYNSRYYNFVSEGQVSVIGNLYLNFVHVSYLSTLLQKYHEFISIVEGAARAGRIEGIIGVLESREETANLINLVRNFYDPNLGNITGSNSTGSISSASYINSGDYASAPLLTSQMLTVAEDGQRIISPIDFDNRSPDLSMGSLTDANAYRTNTSLSRSLDVGLNAIFDSPETRTSLISFFTGGVVSSNSLYENNDGSITENSSLRFDSLSEMVDNSVNRYAAKSPGMIYANPRQFGSASQGAKAIDIAVHYGPPGGLSEENKVYNYSTNSSFMLKGVRFTGESGILRNDDQPVLESYPFLARRKVTIADRNYTRQTQPTG
jgi:hypothetical protein